MYTWSKYVLVSVTIFSIACGSNNPTAPTEEGTTSGNIVAPTPPVLAPPHLRAVWATPEDALRLGSYYQSNTVVLLIDSWGADHTALAAELKKRGMGVMVYVQQIFERPKSGWETGWQQVQKWDQPFRSEGILFGYHAMDEPSIHGLNSIRDEANSFVRSKGYDVLGTEWIEYTSDQGFYKLPRPANLRWYAVTCYDYGGRPKWHFQNCSEEYARHPDWDTVVGQGFDAGNGLPPREQWEALASKLGRGLIWWVY